MSRFPLARAVLRCRRRQLVALAMRAPLLAALLVVAAIMTPFVGVLAGLKAESALRGLLAEPNVATLYALSTAFVTTLVVASWAARRRDLSERLPAIAVSGNSTWRVFVEAELGLLAPVLLLGAICILPALIVLSRYTPGGVAGIAAWTLSSVAVAGVVTCLLELVRAAPARANVLALCVASVAGWVLAPIALGGPLLAGPASAAGAALSGVNVALSVSLLAFLAAGNWTAALRSLAFASRRDRRTRLSRRSRPLPKGAIRASIAALLREVLRTPRARASAAVGLVLGVGGPLAIDQIVPLPAGILLLVGITTTGAAAAMLASTCASRAAALRLTTPDARVAPAASLVALILAGGFTAFSVAVLAACSGGVIGDASIIVKPALFSIAAAVAVVRVDLGDDQELEQFRVAVYALLTASLNGAATLLPFPLALALGLAVLAAGCLYPPSRGLHQSRRFRSPKAAGRLSLAESIVTRASARSDRFILLEPEIADLPRARP